MKGKRDREFSIQFTVGEAATLDGFIVGPDGLLSLTQNGVPIVLTSASTEVSYDRPKRRKVLLHAPLNPTFPSIHPDAHLLRFQSIFAIDTNTNIIRDSRVSVACVISVFVEKNETGYLFNDAPIGAYELHNVRFNPERVAWQLLCDEILQAHGYSSKRTIGIVVDSCLDILDDINRRTIPIVGEHYLPENFTLIYASDAAAESISNRLIRSCDREASRILGIIAQGGAKNSLQPGLESDLYSHFRSWTWLPST